MLIGLTSFGNLRNYWVYRRYLLTIMTVCFTLFVPDKRRPAHATRQPQFHPEPLGKMISREEVLYTGRYRSQNTETSVAPRRVLLAEDDRSFRRYLEIFLKRAGFEVISAADGREALTLLEAGTQ